MATEQCWDDLMQLSSSLLSSSQQKVAQTVSTACIRVLLSLLSVTTMACCCYGIP